MKKTINRKAASIILTIVLILIVPTVIFASQSRPGDLSFADTIVITDNLADGGAKSVEINKEADKEHFERLRDICNNKSPISPYEIPSCMFERYEIEFKAPGKSVTVIPSDDDCDTMLLIFKNKSIYYYFKDSEKQEIIEILEAVGCKEPTKQV